MKVEVCSRNKVSPEVPFMLGGVYRCESNGVYYVLNTCRKGGYQLNAPMGVCLCEGPMDEQKGLTRFLNDIYTRWTYIPNAKLVVEE